MEKAKINHDELRKVNLEVIKSIKKHLHKPKQTKNLFYLPPYERGLILCAIKHLRDLYFDPEVDIANLNMSVHNHVSNIRKGVFNESEVNGETAGITVSGE